MTKLLNIEQFLDEVTEFQMEAEIQIKINQEKNKLLKVKLIKEKHNINWIWYSNRFKFLGW